MKTIAEYDLDFLSIRERELVQIFCKDIVEISSQGKSQKSAGPSSRRVCDLRNKILDLLHDASLNQLRKKLPQETGKDIFHKCETGEKFESLTQKEKEMYDLLANLEYLQQDYEQTQSFFKDRVDKIKHDSSDFFNKGTIRGIIKEYVTHNPDRMFKPKGAY